MAAKPAEGSNFCLIYLTVSPGFTYSDWEKGDPVHLKKLCPEAEKFIESLT